MTSIRVHGRQGFTLIELLVAMAIFGILLGAITAFLSGSIRFSSVAINSADRTRELNDVTSYVLDRAREASDIDLATCAGGAHCVVLTVPVLEAAAASQIVACQQLAFVVEPRGTTGVPGLALEPDTYLDGVGAGRVIVAYTATPVPAADGTCTAVPAVADALVGGAGWQGPFLVLDGVPGAGVGTGGSAPAELFQVVGGDLQMSVQVANATRTGTQFTPASGTYVASVSLRNR